MSAEALRQELNLTAKRLGEIAERLGLNDLSHTILEDTERRLEESRVRAAIIGEIKQGKSTLVNAMIGREAMPVGVTPTTGATVVVRSGVEGGGRLVRESEDQRESVDDERFARLARGAEETEAIRSGHAWLEYVVEPGVLPPELDLVDTPGANDMSHLRTAIAQGELPRADILVLVLDATQMLNRSELAFLRDAVAAVGGLESSGAHLLIAVNRIDLIAERERPKLLEHLERELKALAKGNTPADTTANACPYEVFLIDARSALRNPQSDTPGVRGVANLKHRLFELSSSHHDMLPLRARAGLLRFGALLGHNAAIASHAVSMQLDVLRREIDQLRRDFESHEADMGNLRRMMTEARERLLERSGQRIEEFRGRLHKSVEAAITTASQRTLSGHLPGAIHDAFLAFATEEAERLRVDLDEVTRKVIHTHSEQVRRRLAHATMRLGFRGPTIYIDPPSVALEAGLVAIGVAGTAVMYFGNMVTGLVMAVAGPLATVVLREKSIRDARARARQAVPGALEQGSEALREQIRKVIDGHLGALEEHLLLANVALGQQLEAVLRRAEADVRTSPEDGTGMRRTQAQQELRDLEVEIAAIRDQLQGLG